MKDLPINISPGDKVIIAEFDEFDENIEDLGPELKIKLITELLDDQNKVQNSLENKKLKLINEIRDKNIILEIKTLKTKKQLMITVR